MMLLCQVVSVHCHHRQLVQGVRFPSLCATSSLLESRFDAARPPLWQRSTDLSNPSQYSTIFDQGSDTDPQFESPFIAVACRWAHGFCPVSIIVKASWRTIPKRMGFVLLVSALGFFKNINTTTTDVLRETTIDYNSCVNARTVFRVSYVWQKVCHPLLSTKRETF